jgi:hypothetical protein
MKPDGGTKDRHLAVCMLQGSFMGVITGERAKIISSEEENRKNCCKALWGKNSAKWGVQIKIFNTALEPRQWVNLWYT